MVGGCGHLIIGRSIISIGVELEVVKIKYGSAHTKPGPTPIQMKKEFSSAWPNSLQVVGPISQEMTKVK